MPAFRVMTYNVGNGLAPSQRLVRLLAASGADIVGLQELTHDQAQAIQRALRDDYPHQLLHPAGIPGKALLTRFAVRDSVLLELYPRRPDLVATLDVAGQPLQIIVAHPPPPHVSTNGIRPNDLALNQFRELVKRASAGEPTILLGDFNMRDKHDVYTLLTDAGLTDAYRSVGRTGFTYPLRRGWFPLRPMLRLDYIWHSAHLRAIDARIGPDAGSDHLPVLADLTW